MKSRRVLITGISTYWGGRLAQALEQREQIDVIIGVDSQDPTRELERTEFVRVGTQHALLRRIVEAAEIDTVIDTRLVVDSVTTSPRQAHENNVIGTMNILAACSGPNSTVRKFVFKSSAHYYGSEQDDPAFFTESMSRPHAPPTPIERDIVEAESSVREFAEKNPDVDLTLLRFANVLGPDVKTSHTKLLSLPVVPMILGFDPRYQFVHEDDVVAALEHVSHDNLPGVFNVAADGVLSLTEVCGLLGKPYAPVIPPWGTGLALGQLKRLGLNIPPEMRSQLRYGRGLDNRKLKAADFRYRYTSREAVLEFGKHLRLHPVLRGVREPYRYEREVEEFLRWSPSVQQPESGGKRRLSAVQLVELEKLLSAYGETAGVEHTEDIRAGRAAAETDALERANRAEEAARRAEELAQQALASAEEERRADAERRLAEDERRAEEERRAEDQRAAEQAERERLAQERHRAEASQRAEDECARREADAIRRDQEAEAARRAEEEAETARPLPVEHYDDLESEEIISLLGSLEPEDLEVLLDYERSARARPSVVMAAEGVLTRRSHAGRG